MLSVEVTWISGFPWDPVLDVNFKHLAHILVSFYVFPLYVLNFKEL